MRKIWDIHGGVHPPENKQQTLGEAIGEIPLATEIILPLSQHIGAPATAIVEAGEYVLKGQLIAEAQGIFSASVHASTSGYISAIEERPVAHPSGLPSPCVVITPDGEDKWTELQACENIEALQHEELIQRVRSAGLSGMGGAGFPTAIKLNPKATDAIDTLIINGTECEPYITADDVLMRYHAEEIIKGTQLISQIVGNPKNVLIGIEDNKPHAIEALKKVCTHTNIEVVVFPTKYPSGGEKQLIQILTGREVPSGKLPANIGVLVQNVGTSYAIWRAVRHGEPLIDRVTTVVGSSLTRQRNIRVPLGTPINHILEQHGFQVAHSSRLIIGGPMMGYSVEQDLVPVVKTTNCILAPSVEEMPDAPPAQACIRCGMCSEACPVQLLPQQLLWYAQAEDTDKLKDHNLFDCIECGACSFVCPSAIPLVQYYRAAKGSIKQQESEKKKSDHARIRFEHRKTRIEAAEAAKEAKRQARKKAAEEAKKKLAEKKALPQENGTVKNPSAASDVIAAAAAQANANKDTPEIQRKKLARALSSAQSRLERINKQLSEHQDDVAKTEKLKAQLKQAELKVSSAQVKLNDFDSQPHTKVADVSQQETPLQQRIEQVAQKTLASPIETQQKAVDKIRQTLTTAQQKVQLAEQENKPTLDALKLGVEKLKTKLASAEAELDSLQNSIDPSVSEKNKPSDAAASAISKAQEKAAALASMSPDEKRQGQIDSLIKRIKKSKEKLAKAEAENSEHTEILKTSLSKLEEKLTVLQSQN